MEISGGAGECRESGWWVRGRVGSGLRPCFIGFFTDLLHDLRIITSAGRRRSVSNRYLCVEEHRLEAAIHGALKQLVGHAMQNSEILVKQQCAIR